VIDPEIFTSDFQALPYWWDQTPRPDLGQPPLPARADVVVVGSGYTGLSAALQTARGGRSTVVIDADAAGWGCSTRNGGQVSSSVKPSFSELAARHGQERAKNILLEGHRSLAWLGEFVAE
jgi:glycine/D-amino acid oxidase-like deaminating enzyme